MSEIKDIPKHWEIKKLGEVCDKITKGGTPTTYGFAFVSSGVNFIKIENVEHGKVNLSTIKTFITEEAHNYQRKSMLEENDLLFSIAGTIGETCLIKREYLPANTNQALAILRGYIKTFKPQFLTYQLSSSISQYVKSKARGGAMNNISLEDLKGIELAVPPLHEQQAIVAKIEELLSELENGKQQLQTAQQQLIVYRQSLLKWAFEGRLTGTKKWTSSTLGEICNMKAGFFVKASEILDEYKEGLFSCYGGNGLRGYTKSNTHEGTFSLIGRQGALCGNVHLVSGRFHATEHAVVTTAKSNIDTIWLFYKLRSMRLNQYSQGAAQPGLSVNKLLPIEVQVPPINDQQIIVSELESKLSVCDKIEETISQSLQQAESLRQSILKKAFEGKLV
ncbi:MAG: restriction endonuclease subunit S [Bacteroidetes bacterium]|nr:restriction endonuclease subunit S [Bacteroidota bacterium]